VTLAFLLLAGGLSCRPPSASNTPASLSAADMMIRLARITVDTLYLEQYLAILSEEAEASVRLEPGVFCIYPMVVKDRPNEITILEIYADRDAYEAHLETPHFLHYKTATLPMVESLELIDMGAISPEVMPAIFRKLAGVALQP
jgi:quinol monooxygenase YgiN